MIKTNSIKWILKCIYSHALPLIYRLKYWLLNTKVHMSFLQTNRAQFLPLVASPRFILEILKQIKTGISVSVELHGGG